MIQIKNLSMRLGDFALREINLEVQEKEYFLILGPTGSGKTTLLKCVAGIYYSAEGEIRINGRDVTRLPPEKREIGYVPQDYKLFPHLTVKENIAFGLRNKKSLNREDEVSRLMDLVGLCHVSKRCIKCLSEGERQRVALARALAIQPKLLLLDEPLGALDARMKEKLQTELKRIHEQTERTTIHVTHDLEEALDLADRIAVMRNGRIVQVSEPDDLIRRPNSKFVAEFVGVENILKGTINSGENGTARINLGAVEIFAHTGKTGEAYVSIRPEDVVLSKNSPKTTTRNVFEGIITEVSKRGYLTCLKVDIGVPITVLTTQSLCRDMKLTTGSAVYISFEEAKVHVF